MPSDEDYYVFNLEREVRNIDSGHAGGNLMTLKIENEPVKMIIDSGVSCNLMPKHVFEQVVSTSINKPELLQKVRRKFMLMLQVNQCKPLESVLCR